MIKVLLLNPTIPPRAEPILNELANGSSIDLTVYFYSVSAKNRRWGTKITAANFKYKILKSFDLGFYGKDYFSFNIATDFLHNMLKLKPDVVVVPGWIDLSSYISAVYCRLFGKKLVLRSESTTYEKSWRRSIFMPLTKFMVKTADAYTVSGTRAKEYLMKLGANEKKIFIGYSTVDVERFAKDSRLPVNEKHKLRKKLKINKRDFVIMFNGQLIIRKGIYDLLAAFNKLSKKHGNITLLIVGYGQEEKKIKNRIKEYGLERKIIMTGFAKNTLLPRYYAISNVFVLPSQEETWGMVVNEAMACGLPVIVGHKVGSSKDLVQNKVNGIIFKSGDVTSLSRALEFMLVDDKRVREMAKNAANHIRKFKPGGVALAITKAIELVTESNYI